MNGVAEEAAEFKRDDVLAGPERFRRFSEFGPVYEVLGVDGDTAFVQFVETGEKVGVPLAGVLADPLAP